MLSSYIINPLWMCRNLNPDYFSLRARYHCQLGDTSIDERLGFEPKWLLHPTIFKIAAINRTLPSLELQ